MRLETSVALTVNDECSALFRKGRIQKNKHSAWGVPSQGRNSKELTARENNGGTLGFNRKQHLKPFHSLYGIHLFFKRFQKFLEKEKTFFLFFFMSPSKNPKTSDLGLTRLKARESLDWRTEPVTVAKVWDELGLGVKG